MNNKVHVSILNILCLLLLLVSPGAAIKMTLSIPGLERQCFFEVLGTKSITERIPKNTQSRQSPATIPSTRLKCS